MSTSHHHSGLLPSTVIALKISRDGLGKHPKHYVAFDQLTPELLPKKVREVLLLPESSKLQLERYSDSVEKYTPLREDDVDAYKTLKRAATAKLRLKLRVTVMENASLASPVTHAPSVVRDAVTLSPPPPPPSSASTPLVEVDAKPTCPQLGLAGLSAAQSARLKTFYHCLGPSKTAQSDEKPDKSIAFPNAWSIFCNNCDENMLKTHYHCNTCDDGDYDLCPACVSTGAHCHNQNHWLIERFYNPAGHLITSTTQFFVRKQESATKDSNGSSPAASTEDKVQPAKYPKAGSNVCNNCMYDVPDSASVSCGQCDLFILCLRCLEQGKHGHHPAHEFTSVTKTAALDENHRKLCKPGRNVVHAAICDNCDETIFGIRHKCQVCPDWDYCSKCVRKASVLHPTHRFAPIYDSLPLHALTTDPRADNDVHDGIYCDGPLCAKNTSYIRGIRYKCTICPDVDFCANCEASPTLVHNKTHPMVKARTRVRGFSIQTEVTEPFAAHADKCVRREAAQPSADAAEAQAHAGAEYEAARAKVEEFIANDLAYPLRVMPQAQACIFDAEKRNRLQNRMRNRCSIQAQRETQLDAQVEYDISNEGSPIVPGSTFLMSWTVKNSGPGAWPAGTTVRYVSGDAMFNFDTTKPLADADLRHCYQSNALPYDLPTGNSFAFKIELKAAPRLGCATSFWRLKTPSGVAFGDRLFCHIKVVAPNKTGAEDKTSCRTCSSNCSGLSHKMVASMTARDSKLFYPQTSVCPRWVNTGFRGLPHRTGRPGTAAWRLHGLDQRMGSSTVASPNPMEDVPETVTIPTAEASIETLKVAAESETDSSMPVTESSEKPLTKLEAIMQELNARIASVEAKAAESKSAAAPVAELEANKEANAVEDVPEAQKTSEHVDEDQDDDLSIFDDAETINVSSSEEDAALTDDEYDILDAADRHEA